MILPRALSPLVLALALAAPVAAGAQSASAAPDALRSLTDQYFTAVATADVATIGGITTTTFHVIDPDGKRLSYDDYLRRISALNLIAMAPRGNSQRIRSTSITPAGAIETVDTQHWFYGAVPVDPMNPPRTETDFATHRLTWVKSADGRWLLDEDHITYFQSD